MKKFWNSMGILLLALGLVLSVGAVSVTADEEQEAIDFANLFLELVNTADSDGLRELFAPEVLLAWEDIMEEDFMVFQSFFNEALTMDEEERMEHWEDLLVPEDEVWRMEELLEMIVERGLDDPETNEKMEEIIRLGTLWQLAYFAAMDDFWMVDEELAAEYIKRSSLGDNGYIFPQEIIFIFIDIDELEPEEEMYEELIVQKVNDMWHITMVFEDDDWQEEWGPNEMAFGIKNIEGSWLIVELH